MTKGLIPAATDIMSGGLVACSNDRAPHCTVANHNRVKAAHGTFSIPQHDDAPNITTGEIRKLR